MARLSHDEKMLDRPWLARHAMARHTRDFESFRKTKLRSFAVAQALAEACSLRDAKQDTTAAIAKLKAAKAVGAVDVIVTTATHERLNQRIAPSLVDEVYVMRAIRDDRIRRDLHITFRQSTRWVSYGSILASVVIAYFGLGWAWDHTDSLRKTYQAAILDYQDAQPKSLRQKAAELAGFGKQLAADTKANVAEKLDERRARQVERDANVIDSIRRRRGD